MSWHDITVTIGIVSSGLIAGQMLAIGQSNLANTAQPASEWVRRFQLENKLFTRTMPPALLIPLVTLAASIVAAKGAELACYALATIGMATVLLITMAIHVPINRTVAAWLAADPPANGAAARNRWLRSHRARTAVGIPSFSVAGVAAHFA